EAVGGERAVGATGRIGPANAGPPSGLVSGAVAERPSVSTGRRSGTLRYCQSSVETNFSAELTAAWLSGEVRWYQAETSTSVSGASAQFDSSLPATPCGYQRSSSLRWSGQMRHASPQLPVPPERLSTSSGKLTGSTPGCAAIASRAAERSVTLSW